MQSATKAETTYTEVPLRDARVRQILNPRPEEGDSQRGWGPNGGDDHTIKLYTFLGFKSRRFIVGGQPLLYTVRNGEEDPDDLYEKVCSRSASIFQREYCPYDSIPGKIITDTFDPEAYEMYAALGLDYIVLPSHADEELSPRRQFEELQARLQFEEPIGAPAGFLMQHTGDVTVKLPDVVSGGGPPRMLQSLAGLYGARYVEVGRRGENILFALHGLGKEAEDRYEAYLHNPD